MTFLLGSLSLSLPPLSLSPPPSLSLSTKAHTFLTIYRASLSGTFLQTLPDLVTLIFIYAQLSTDAVSALRNVWVLIKLQARVYDIFPSTTAVFSYAIGSRKLSANEQFFCFFVGAQTVVSLLQTTQIKQVVSFIAANKVNTSTNKTTIV